MSKGLRHNPLADIELIKQNLKDRYPSPGFPILKELLQNAEDSSAKLVHFAWTRGIELAEHPLLRGPALIAVNDGEFTPDDREAIRQMGLSDKLRAGASIGKFGLGLKSVFYLCEAFLYVAQTTGDPAPEGDILNPWSGEPGSGYSFHAEWDDFSPDDRHRIVDHLGSFLNSPQWFCLWIPLRQKVHCGEIDPIEPLYLGDIPGVPAFLTAHSLSQSFSTALPLLVNVERIKVSLQLAGGQFEPELDMQLLPGAHRRKYRRKYDLNQVMALGLGLISGGLQLSNGTTSIFSGQEAVVESDRVKALRKFKGWPSSTRVDPITKMPGSVKERLDPHGAAIWSRHPGEGSLAVNWAAFLPLGELIDPVHCDSKWDYTLLLHGDFFVDPGRNQPEFRLPGDALEPASDGEGELRPTWNRNLAATVVLPRVLPALNEFAPALQAHEVPALTRAVVEAFTSNDLAPWRADLCSVNQWAYCLGDNGGGWQLLQADERLVAVPAPPDSNLRRATDVFPALKTIAQELRVTFGSWPRITPAQDLVAWSQDALLAMLDIDVTFAFGSEPHLRYLVEFLSIAGDQSRSIPVRQRLVTLARHALEQVPLATLGHHRGLVREFLGRLDPEHILPLNPGATDCDEGILRSLARLDVGVLAVPADLAPVSATERPSLLIADAVALLKALGSATVHVPDIQKADVVASLARQILTHCGNGRAAVLEQCRDVVLFKVSDKIPAADLETLKPFLRLAIGLNGAWHGRSRRAA